MKKIGELKGIPVVEGNVNEVTRNQIHYKESGGEIQLSKRDNENKLNNITSGSSSNTTSNVKYYSFDPDKNEFSDEGISMLSQIVTSVKGIFYDAGKYYSILPTYLYNGIKEYPFDSAVGCKIDYNVDFINFHVGDENGNPIYLNSLYDYLSRISIIIGVSSLEEFLSKLGLTECTKEEFYDLTKE